MKDVEFENLCKSCDLILLERMSRERVSNCWLHVLRPHPEVLKKYRHICSSDFYLLKVAAKNLAHFGWSIACSLLFSWPWGRKPLKKKSTVLIISHLVNPNHLNEPSDFYFGDLMQELADADISSTTALINHTKQLKLSVEPMHHCSKMATVILPKYQSLVNEIRVVCRLMLDGFRLLRRSLLSTSDAETSIFRFASAESFSAGSKSALRLGIQIGELVDFYRPRILMVTFEGHAWERLAFSYARSVAPDIVCIAYQHAPVFFLQHAMKRALAPEYDPDYIFCSGLNGKREIEASGGFKNVPTFLLGSHRWGNPRLSMESYLKKNSCLVIPEGFKSEVGMLYDFALKCSLLHPEIKFIFRLHPSMKFSDLNGVLGKYRNIPSNVVLSRGPLENDIRISKWALYRGSSAIIQACIARVWPIYLAQPDEISINVLEEVKELVSVVMNVKDFRKIVNVSNINPSEMDLIRDYCLDAYTKLEYADCVRLIQKAMVTN
jgi:hypothetical protein